MFLYAVALLGAMGTEFESISGEVKVAGSVGPAPERVLKADSVHD